MRQEWRMSVMLSLRNLAGPVSYLPHIDIRVTKMREQVKGTEAKRQRRKHRHKG